MRNRYFRSVLFVLLTLWLCAAESQAASFREGDVRVRQLDTFGFTAANSRLLFDTGGSDQVFEMFGYIGNGDGAVRIDAINFDIVSSITATANIATARVTLSAAGAAVLGLTTGDIDIEYTFTLTDDTGPLDADSFAWNADITNASAGAMDLIFYNYLDLHLAGSGDSDDDVVTANAYRIMVRDPDDPDAFVWESLSGPADHFQVAESSALRDQLDGMSSATDLTDTGAFFGPANFTAAFQNDLLNLNAGDTVMVGYAITATPEPSTGLLLGLGLIGLSVERRRQSRVLARS